MHGACLQEKNRVQTCRSEFNSVWRLFKITVYALIERRRERNRLVDAPEREGKKGTQNALCLRERYRPLVDDPDTDTEGKQINVGTLYKRQWRAAKKRARQTKLLRILL